MRIEDHTKDAVTMSGRTAVCTAADGTVTSREEQLVREHFLEVSVNGYVAARLSCTADHLKELVIGRLYTEGLIRETEDVDRLFLCAKGNIAEVTLSEKIEFRPFDGREPSCCAGNRQFLSATVKLQPEPLPETAVDPQTVFALAEYFRRDSALHRTTSGTHSCYLYRPDGEIRCFEDLSRHNAMDKAVGHVLLEGLRPGGCMLYTTGRVPVDMVQKAVAAGVPVLVSKSVPTDAAVDLAHQYGLRLICKAWPDSYVRY